MADQANVGRKPPCQGHVARLASARGAGRRGILHHPGGDVGCLGASLFVLASRFFWGLHARLGVSHRSQSVVVRDCVKKDLRIVRFGGSRGDPCASQKYNK